jgi:pimeloyl-ACP methyl ester carboxylesterase
MDDHSTHTATSKDGTPIVGRVIGEGPPLVFVHGVLDDGSLDWPGLVDRLRDRFTCHVVSTRGRGESGQSDDLSPPRRVEDVTAYADSLDAPVGLVGLSGGAQLSLGAAAEARDVRGVVAYEPPVFEAADEEMLAGLRQSVDAMAAAAAEGRVADGARAFLTVVSNEAEVEALTQAGGFESAGRFVPHDLEEFAQAFAHDGPTPTDPATLARIGAPVLVLVGEKTALGWFRDGAHFIEAHAPDSTVREVPGAGHLGPIAAPERVAPIVAEFFAGRA